MHYGIKHFIKLFMNNYKSVVLMTPTYKCAKSIYQQYSRSDIHVLNQWWGTQGVKWTKWGCGFVGLVSSRVRLTEGEWGSLSNCRIPVQTGTLESSLWCSDVRWVSYFGKIQEDLRALQLTGAVPASIPGSLCLPADKEEESQDSELMFFYTVDTGPVRFLLQNHQ